MPDHFKIPNAQPLETTTGNRVLNGILKKKPYA